MVYRTQAGSLRPCPRVASVIDNEQPCTRNEESAKLGRAAKKSELSGVKAAGTIIIQSTAKYRLLAFTPIKIIHPYSPTNIALF